MNTFKSLYILQTIDEKLSLKDMAKLLSVFKKNFFSLNEFCFTFTLNELE